MNKKYSVLSTGIGLSVIFTIVLFLGFSNDDWVILEQDNITQYIPSDITKINPKFVKGGSQLWATTDIKDVKNEVIFTVQGTVLSIGETIDWNTGHKILGNDQIIGFVPVIVSVEEVYKGNLTENTFTFYLTPNKMNEQYIFFHDDADFEVGEKILVHLGHSTLGPFPDGNYYPKLGEFGKYQLQVTVNTLDQSGDVEYVAFGAKYPNGVPLTSIANEAFS